MPIGECLARHTHRQYLTWMAWLGEEWNRPDRTDYYLMQAAAEVRRGNVKNPRSVKLESFKLSFGMEQATPQQPHQQTREEAAAASKAKRLGMMTVPVTHVTVPRE